MFRKSEVEDIEEIERIEYNIYVRFCSLKRIDYMKRRSDKKWRILWNRHYC